jgi:uncharacterized protein YjbI with pentapeptide repeats
MSSVVSATTLLCHCGDRIPDSSPIGEYSKEIINRDVCQNLSVEYEYEGNNYCILHYPSKEKGDEFEKVILERLSKQEYKFQGIWFPRRTEFFHNFDFVENEVNFSFAYFASQADFWHATFPNKTIFEFATFKNEALFSFVVFNVANFHEATFNGRAIFYNTRFKKLAHFRSTRFAEDTNFVFARIKNAFFSEAKFESFENKRINVSFYDARFLKLAMFDQVKFPEITNFNKARFNGNVLFTNSFFKHAYFDSAKFLSNVLFSYSQFEENVYFHNVIFKKLTDCTNTAFFNSVKFAGKKRQLSFSFKSIVSFEHIFAEKAERVSFHTVRLHPGWFVNADLRKFVFTNINWENSDGSYKSIKAELENLRKRKIPNRHRLLIIACRQIAVNAEENNRYEEASNFRRMAFETEWIEKKENFLNWVDKLPKEADKLKKRFAGSISTNDLPTSPTNTFAIARLFDFMHLFYRITSYYGESWGRAFIILFFILTVSAFLYTQSYFNVCLPNEACQIRTLNPFEAITHSISTAILQNPETRKPLGYAELIVTLEKIFAPLQAALLALAIRRKFMR